MFNNMTGDNPIVVARFPNQILKFFTVPDKINLLDIIQIDTMPLIFVSQFCCASVIKDMYIEPFIFGSNWVVTGTDFQAKPFSPIIIRALWANGDRS